VAGINQPGACMNWWLLFWLVWIGIWIVVLAVTDDEEY
jgi:hypothetical protein